MLGLRRSWRCAVVLAFAIIVSFGFGISATGANGCQITCKAAGGDYQSTVDKWRLHGLSPSGSDVLRVPVILRMMELGGTHPSVQEAWTSKQVEAFFGVNSNDAPSAFWNDAKPEGVGPTIQFALQGIDVCQYQVGPPPPRLTNTGSAVVTPPDGTPQATWSAEQRDAKEQLDALRACMPDRGIVVYLWPEISGSDQSSSGYGQLGPSMPTIWLDNSCPNGDFRQTCITGIAHELGHALGLDHICGEVNSNPPVISQCGQMIDRCPFVTDNLMESPHHGYKLCENQWRIATSKIRMILEPTP